MSELLTVRAAMRLRGGEKLRHVETGALGEVWSWSQTQLEPPVIVLRYAGDPDVGPIEPFQVGISEITERRYVDELTIQRFSDWELVQP